MSRKTTRYAQLKEGSVPTTRDIVKAAYLNGAIQLFNKDINKVVGHYSFEYVPERANLDVDYLLSKLEDWTKDHSGYTILLSRESTCVNDLTCFMLEEGKYIAVESGAFSNVYMDFRSNSPNYAGVFIKYLVTRVDLASVLAPLYIVETTESDIRSCKEAYANQVAMQRQVIQQSRGPNMPFGNMQNNPFGR